MIPIPSLPLPTPPPTAGGIPQRPPHPLLLKAVDSQIHILFKAWIHLAYSLPLTPELDAGEVYSQMDARVQIFAIITYEFNRLIADFSLEYGNEHPCLRETSIKDVTAYEKCTETDISRLWSLWNEYSEMFEEKFREARKEKLPKRQANLMKEELSRLLYVSKAMEKVWLNTEGTEKDEGIRKWIADTTAYLPNNTHHQMGNSLMRKILAENKTVAERFGEDLRAKLERRKYAILNNNYVQEDCEKFIRRHCPSNEQGVERYDRITEIETNFGNSPPPSSKNNSVRDGEENKGTSEGSYDEFDINDMRYLTPMLFPRPATPMALISLKPGEKSYRPSTPVISLIPPPNYPPPPLPLSPVSPELVKTKLSRLLPKKRSTPQVSTLQPEAIRLTYPASTRSCSTSSSALEVTCNEDPGFLFKALFSSRPKPAQKEDYTQQTPDSETTSEIISRQLSYRALTPPLPAPPIKPPQKPRSMADLRSSTNYSPHSPPPEIPERNPNRPSQSGYTKLLLEGSGSETGPRPPLTNMHEAAHDHGVVHHGLTPTVPMLRSKGSMFFNGKIVKEVPKGEEDAFLEHHTYRGELL